MEVGDSTFNVIMNIHADCFLHDGANLKKKDLKQVDGYIINLNPYLVLLMFTPRSDDFLH